MGRAGPPGKPARSRPGPDWSDTNPPGHAGRKGCPLKACPANAAEDHDSPSAVAARLEDYRSSIWRWIPSGALGPILKLGPRTIRTPESALLRFLEDRRV